MLYIIISFYRRIKNIIKEYKEREEGKGIESFKIKSSFFQVKQIAVYLYLIV